MAQPVHSRRSLSKKLLSSQILKVVQQIEREEEDARARQKDQEEKMGQEVRVCELRSEVS